jgi:large subunit ribosomal protein L6
MSRVGKTPITIPSDVTFTNVDRLLSMKGKFGTKSYQLPENVLIETVNSVIQLNPRDKTKQSISLWGTAQRTLTNMVKGVGTGFSVTLNLVGVGYRASVAGSKITLQLGFSHVVVYDLPEGFAAKCDKPTEIVITGPDKQQVGQIASEIRKHRKPEPYKGKGVIRSGEFIVRKEGKKK